MSTELEAPNPGLIAELFSRDPLLLTVTDRRQMIEYFRKNRAMWVQSGKGGPQATRAKASKESVTGKLSLDDIGL